MSKRKKIMHIAQSAGGVYRYLVGLLKSSDINNYHIILVVSEDYIKYMSLLETYVDDIEIINMKRDINPVEDIRSIKMLRNLMKKYNPDLIYAHSSKAGAISRLTCITNRTPIIYNAHGWSFNIKTSFLKRHIYVIIEKLLAYRTTQIINISKYELESARKNKIAPTRKLKLIYNGIEIENSECSGVIDYPIQKKIENFNIEGSKVIIGAVGRISNQKCPLDFVELANRVIKKIPNALFLWVGDGEKREEMDNLIKEKNLSNNIIITGWVENPRAYIKRFDIALLLSSWEGFGLVLAEYMLEKKPIIATRIDAIPELIEHDVNGFTIDIHDIDTACDYIIKYIEDKLLIVRHTESSYKKVIEEFNISRVVAEHEQLYREILGDNEYD